MMNRRVIAAFATGALAALGVGVAIGAQSETSQGGGADFTRFAALSGANEIGSDGRRGAGDNNGRGSFSAVLDGNTLCFGLTVANVGDPVAAHIHRGGRNANGDVVITLKHPKAGDPGASSKCTQISGALADALVANPSRFYVNVHNERFPAGAIRGQVFGG